MLFDSDVIIWGLRGNKKALEFLTKTPDVYISIITHMEILRGAYDKKEYTLIKTLFSEANIRILPLNEAISSKAFYWIENYALSHRLDILDALIAATADLQGFTLLTGNFKDFHFLPGLNLKIFKE